MATPEFPRRDPAGPDFWNLRYAARFAPWDAQGVPRELQAFAATLPPRTRVLVPGCGSAWDVRFLADSGCDVLGIDFSAEAVTAAHAILGPHAARVREADVFAPITEAPFDIVYERAFLCALPRRLWTSWGARMAELVGSGGTLAGYFFIEPAAAEHGPPYALVDDAELRALLEPAFVRIDEAPASASIAVFAGRERWQRWRRQ
jgi:SAM-dependent methyltransferase